MQIQRSVLLALVMSVTLAGAARADDDLTDLDLATLMNMDVTVTSASRRAQSLEDAPAAIFVITREDIRRSGATTLPEILRLAPGMQVSRVNTRSWAVSARGFNHRFANKLLVMVDGRSIYTSAFSGVMWEEQPILLANVERIEIVRGPGGALWGVNAVNGVINIITREAASTHGVRMSATGGSTPDESASLRVGFEGGWGDYRAYVAQGRTDPLRPTDFDWDRTQAGFRVDGAAGGGALTLQGDVHEGDFGAPDGPDMIGLSRRARTGSVLSSWTRAYEPGRFDVRAYYSWTDRSRPIEWNESALAVEAQFAAKRLGRHAFNAGVGARRTADEQEATTSDFSITESTQYEWSVYGQDELNFFDDRVRLTVGAKIESSEFAGTEVQPTLRGLWDVTSTHTLWSAFSRASRAPSRFELHSGIHLDIPQGQIAPLPVEVVVQGNDDLKPETMEAYEAGWRWRPNRSVSVDLALYRNEYEHLILLRSLPPQVVFAPSPHIEQHMAYRNAGSAVSHGAELATEWAAMDGLRLQAFAARHDIDEGRLETGVSGGLGGKDVGRTASVRARIDVSPDTEIDLAWRSLGASLDGAVPAYDAVDMRVAWRPLHSLELSFGVENLLDEEHVESDDFLSGSLGVELGRSYFASFVWRPKR